MFSGDCVGKLTSRSYLEASSSLPELTCFLHYSEIKVYDPSGDSTLPAVSKKRKIQEVEEQEAGVAVKAKKFKAEMKG